jgi:hypothetical protein
VFRPRDGERREGDLVWIGNWGDDERSDELHRFLLRPVEALRLRARVYGVRYPEEARRALEASGIEYAGWLPNYDVPRVFARFRATVHVPRRPYAGALPGIPTIRPFEALACGMPLVCAPWDDSEGLFTPGRDYLVARDEEEMTAHLRRLLSDAAYAAALADEGRRTVLARHTCRHRVEELLQICARLFSPAGEPQRPPREAQRLLSGGPEDSFRGSAFDDAQSRSGARRTQGGATRASAARSGAVSSAADPRIHSEGPPLTTPSRGAERGALGNR